MTLTNSTLSGNVVYRPAGHTGTADGGGLYVYNGQAQLFNVTIANNRVMTGRFPNVYSGNGGGLYVNVPPSSVLTIQNTIIAKNIRGNGLTLSVPDDCYSVGGTTGMLVFSLLQTTTNCFISGPQGGNIEGQDPLLGSLQNNCGLTQTQNLLTGSPAIDTGATTGCTGAAGSPITVDQRGFRRPFGPTCDIGAIEYTPTAPMIFLPLVRK